MDYTCEQIAKMIDHSLLNPVIPDAELEAGCQTALQCAVASVCIKPYYLKRCAEILQGSNVAPTTTIGFPHGSHTTSVKAAEARQALDEGARELDMVVNIGKVISEDWGYVQNDIKAIVDLAHERKALVKVIFENCYLQDKHKIKLCSICGELRADFVKTSTGYGSGGANIVDIKLMREHSPAHVQVKAAGGIRTLAQLLEVRALGVTRVGATKTVEILQECKKQLEKS